jgi:hypothetical protein
MSPDHLEFVTRFKTRDHPTEYRMRATTFCHKIFTLHHFADKVGNPDFLVWWDGDAIMNRPVALDELAKLMPREGEVASYLGRKDWDHSECGFVAYNMRAGGKALLDAMHYYYVSGSIFSLAQWNDCYLFDQLRKGQPAYNISEGVPGNNVWEHTLLSQFSEHRKGVEAKQRGKALSDREFYARG